MHEIELKWIQQFQALLRFPFMDRFFLAWNYVDTFASMVIIIALAWFFIDKRIGIQLSFVLLLSSILNGLLKSSFLLPRPCQIDSTVGIICFSSPGFPSGAAQSAAIIAGICLIEAKKKLYWSLGILFAFLLCTSRIYLGVHYFTDILGGLCVGCCLVVVYWGLSFLTLQNELKLFILFSILLFLIHPSNFIVQSGLLFGLSLGLLLSNKEEIDRKEGWLRRSLKLICALSGLFIFSALKDIYPAWKLLFVFAEGFWFSYSPYTLRAVFKSSKRGSY